MVLDRVATRAASERHRRVAGSAAASVLALTLLSGCKEEKKEPPTPAAAVSLSDRVRQATEQNLRAGAPPQMRFRGVQVYTQAMPQRMAVCGQLNPFADDQNIFVPFVSVVTIPISPEAGTPQYQFENHIGSSTAEASRVYVALVDYCYEKGGPTPGPFRSVMSTPPLPDSIPDPRSKPPVRTAGQSPPATNAAAGTAPAVTVSSSANAAAAQTPSPPTAAPTSTPDSDQLPDSVTMRQSANLHADPGGATIRVIPHGTSMHVFGQARGGWLQVGDTAPWGWVHESMLDKH